MLFLMLSPLPLGLRGPCQLERELSQIATITHTWGGPVKPREGPDVPGPAGVSATGEHYESGRLPSQPLDQNGGESHTRE